jgi:ABC-2 type transport system permease protein
VIAMPTNFQNTLTIAGRQFRGYFNSPVAYIVICLMLLVLGGIFWEPFFLMGHASVRQMFTFLGPLLAVAAPAISMGLLAEERRSGTLELLLAMPVRESEVILGKYLASLGLLGVLLVMTFFYPLSVAALGNLDWGPVFTGYFGIFLEGAAFMAIGLAASSFTENQLIAFFVSLMISTSLAIFIGWFLPFMPTGVITDVAQWVSFDQHLESLTRGVIALRDVVYFLSVATLSLMLAFRALESRRWS